MYIYEYATADEYRIYGGGYIWVGVCLCVCVPHTYIIIIIYSRAIIRNIRSTLMVIIIIISTSSWPEQPRFEIFVHYGGGYIIYI